MLSKRGWKRDAFQKNIHCVMHSAHGVFRTGAWHHRPNKVGISHTSAAIHQTTNATDMVSSVSNDQYDSWGEIDC